MKRSKSHKKEPSAENSGGFLDRETYFLAKEWVILFAS